MFVDVAGVRYADVMKDHMTVKIKALWPFKTSGAVIQVTRSDIPENANFQNTQNFLTLMFLKYEHQSLFSLKIVNKFY